MVKVYTQNFSYDYPFATVTLAYFLRYPNPYSRHVISTDVLERYFDPETQRLYTTRLHLKRSRVPAAVLRLLPKSFLGTNANGDSQAYILERSTVDVKEGWMKTESRNLEMTKVLDVVERQVYRKSDTELSKPAKNSIWDSAINPGDRTDVVTTVTLHSRFGQRFRKSRTEEDNAPKEGFFTRWSTSGLQRSIEAIGLSRATKSQPNATEGMKVVMERLRQGGLVAVLEGMRRDRDGALMPQMANGASIDDAPKD